LITESTATLIKQQHLPHKHEKVAQKQQNKKTNTTLHCFSSEEIIVLD
jgi:hypothetical protein